MQHIILIGNAITAEILYGYIRRDARYCVAGTAVDDEYTEKNLLSDIPCVGFSQLRERFSPDNHRALMASGYDNLNRTRESLFNRVRDMGYTVETYVHPDAGIYSERPIGEGSVVLPGAVIEPHVEIGMNSFIWCNATLAHHSRVGDHCWVAAGAVLSGKAVVGHNCFIGVNATLVNEVEVGDHSIVGASALMSKCVKPFSVYLARSGEPFRCSSEEYVKYFGV